MSDSEHIKEILAHERIWQSLNDKATEALDAFGTKDYRGRADYWMTSPPARRESRSAISAAAI
jgi:hypothetical protein